MWQDGSQLIGIEPSDPQEQVKRSVQSGMRRYAYNGTAGSRNRHEFTGRVT